MKNLETKTVNSRKGFALAFAVTCLGGKTFANPSTDSLKTLENYVKQEGIKYNYTENGINMGPLYKVDVGEFNIQVTPHFMLIKGEGEKNTMVIFDNKKDGIADSAIVVPGRVNKQEGYFLEGDAMARTELDMLTSDAELSQMGKKGTPYDNKQSIYFNKDSVLHANYANGEVFNLDRENASKIASSVSSLYEKMVGKIFNLLGSIAKK